MVRGDYDYPEAPPWAKVLAILLLIAIFAWVYVVKPALYWVNQNLLLVGAVILIILVIAAIVVYRWKKAMDKEWEEKQRREEEYRKQGLVKCIRHGNEVWTSPEQAKVFAREEVKEQLVNRVAQAIREYQPPRPLRDEYAYQMGLHGYLAREFKTVEVEVQRGHSRPDIVIGDIAIEVKGPTDTMALQTVPDKAMRYMQKFKHLIVVLFEPRFNEGRYDEWLEGMRHTYNNVIVIRK